MSNLIWTFEDIYKSISEYLGLGSSPTGSDLTKVKNIVYKGYFHFLTAVNPTTGTMHPWSFLRQRKILQTQSGTWRYLLPENFWMMYSSVIYEKDSGFRPLTKVSGSTIEELRSYTTYNSEPEKFAIVDGSYSPLKKQRKEILFYPTCDSDHSFILEYLMMPEKPVNATDYFIGGPEVSECIRLCGLMVAEKEEDEFAGQMTSLAKEMMAKLVLSDERENIPDTVGPMDAMGKVNSFYQNIDRIRALQNITEVYGVEI